MRLCFWKIAFFSPLFFLDGLWWSFWKSQWCIQFITEVRSLYFPYIEFPFRCGSCRTFCFHLELRSFAISLLLSFWDSKHFKWRAFSHIGICKDMDISEACHFINSNSDCIVSIQVWVFPERFMKNKQRSETTKKVLSWRILMAPASIYQVS